MTSPANGVGLRSAGLDSLLISARLLFPEPCQTLLSWEPSELSFTVLEPFFVPDHRRQNVRQLSTSRNHRNWLQHNPFVWTCEFRQAVYPLFAFLTHVFVAECC